MNRVPALLAATMVLLVASVTVPALAVPALPAAAPETITCHMLIGGQPSQDTQTFRWTPRGLFNGPRLISSTRLVELGGFTDKGVRVKSFARHEWQGGKLHRTAFWQYPGRPMQVAMREVYDFRAQQIWDVTRKPYENCHHNGR